VAEVRNIAKPTIALRGQATPDFCHGKRCPAPPHRSRHDPLR
jgi:hypothetical protein